MAQENVSELLNALRPALQAAAKNVLRHAYGPDGMPWGTTFTDAEDMAVALGDQLSRDILHAALHSQAQQPRPDDLTACPCCVGPLDARDDQPRQVLCRRGHVLWQEPAAYCPRCRRAFFPSVQEPGT